MHSERVLEAFTFLEAVLDPAMFVCNDPEVALHGATKCHRGELRMEKRPTSMAVAHQ